MVRSLAAAGVTLSQVIHRLHHPHGIQRTLTATTTIDPQLVMSAFLLVVV